MIIIPLPLPGAFFNGSNIKATVAWKVCWHIYEDSQEYFPFRTYIPPSFPSRRAPLGLAEGGREGGRGATSRPFIFIEASLVEAFQEGRKAGEREREREIHPPWRKTTREIWSLFDNVHLIRSALCEGGVGLEVKGGGHWLRREVSRETTTTLGGVENVGEAERDLNFL